MRCRDQVHPFGRHLHLQSRVGLHVIRSALQHQVLSQHPDTVPLDKIRIQTLTQQLRCSRNIQLVKLQPETVHIAVIHLYRHLRPRVHHLVQAERQRRRQNLLAHLLQCIDAIVFGITSDALVAQRQRLHPLIHVPCSVGLLQINLRCHGTLAVLLQQPVKRQHICILLKALRCFLLLVNAPIHFRVMPAQAVERRQHHPVYILLRFVRLYQVGIQLPYLRSKKLPMELTIHLLHHLHITHHQQMVQVMPIQRTGTTRFHKRHIAACRCSQQERRVAQRLLHVAVHLLFKEVGPPLVHIIGHYPRFRFRSLIDVPTLGGHIPVVSLSHQRVQHGPVCWFLGAQCPLLQLGDTHPDAIGCLSLQVIHSPHKRLEHLWRILLGFRLGKNTF